MRKIIASLVAGIVLGTVGTAGAVTAVYWEGQGKGYFCEGVQTGFYCSESSGYRVGMTKSFVYIAKGDKNLAACERKLSPLAGCFADGRVFTGP